MTKWNATVAKTTVATTLTIAASITMISLVTGHRPHQLIRAAFQMIRSSTRSITSRCWSQSKTVIGMPKLPSNVVKYSQVPGLTKPPFTANTIPRGLLKEHNTKTGTWGVINVMKGSLEYKIVEPKPDRVFILQATAEGSFSTTSLSKGIIEPTILHQVKALSDDLEFIVEFYRSPGTGPVNEKRE